MAIDWLRLCQGDGLAVSGDEVDVAFANGRHHRVRVEARPDAVHIAGVVLGVAQARRAEVDEVTLWMLNRGTRLTSFQIDVRGRVVGEALLPVSGLNSEELQFRVRMVAEECDLLEKQLTGDDL